MRPPQAAIDFAIKEASRDPSAAARELLLELFDGRSLTRSLAETLSAIAEHVTAVRMGTAPAGPGLAAAEALGDDWFQCPHCAEVFESEAASCTSCGRPLAMARTALEIVLGDATLWLRAAAPDRRPSGATVTKVEWLRVVAGARWFELLDEAGRTSTTTRLAATVITPPNVAVVGLRDGDRALLVHPTKLEVHVIDGGELRRDGAMSATELTVRELGNVLYPDGHGARSAIVSKGHALEPNLDAAIRADPDHPEAYLVYADWLQAQGDPRGELIMLQHANETVRANRLLDERADHFLGRLASASSMLESSHHALGRQTTWRWGFLESLWISNTRDEAAHALDVDQALAAALDHPSCRVLRDLTVGIVAYEDNSYDDIAKVIGARELPTLRSLVLGDFDSEETELNWSHMGDVSPMYRAMPNLTSLTLRSGSMKLGAIELPNLESLTIITGGFDPASLASICNAAWPTLTTLSIQLGNEARFTLEHLAPIFEARVFPKVRTLGLGNSSLSDEICRGLAHSKIAAQLVVFDLSQGTLGDDGARALATGSFPMLEKLDVDQSYLTDVGIAVLSKLAKHVELGTQRDDGGDPSDRYIAARE